MIVRQNRGLKSFDLRGINNTTDMALGQFGQALTSLTELNMLAVRDHVTPEKLQIMVDNMPRLKFFEHSKKDTHFVLRTDTTNGSNSTKHKK